MYGRNRCFNMIYGILFILMKREFDAERLKLSFIPTTQTKKNLK